MTSLSRIEVYRDRENLWRFRAVALNGEVVAVGESYQNRDDCVAEAKRLWPDDGVVLTDDQRVRNRG